MRHCLTLVQLRSDVNDGGSIWYVMLSVQFDTDMLHLMFDVSVGGTEEYVLLRVQLVTFVQTRFNVMVGATDWNESPRVQFETTPLHCRFVVFVGAAVW